MFKSIRRVSYRANDIEKAKQWYCDILNLRPVVDTPFIVVFKIGDCSLTLSPGSDQPSQYTQSDAFWEVEEIESAYKRLIDLGAQPHTPIRTLMNVSSARVIDPFGNIIGITGRYRNAEGQTLETKPSESAMAVALLRALATREEREEIKGADHLAELFVSEEMGQSLKEEHSRKMVLKGLGQIYGFLVARTAFIDNLFRQSLIEKIPQIVFLGAGYDTRAYRFKELISNTRIFELDIESTQKRKLSIVKNSKIAIPDALTFVTINFKTDSLFDSLRNAGYHASEKTLFVWEGVTYYLEKPAIESTLKFVQEHSLRGSTVCLDYSTEGSGSLFISEPTRFHLDTERMRSLLSSFGMSVKEHLDSTEMERRFLTLKDGSLAETVYSKFCLLYAEKIV